MDCSLFIVDKILLSGFFIKQSIQCKHQHYKIRLFGHHKFIHFFDSIIFVNGHYFIGFFIFFQIHILQILVSLKLLYDSIFIRFWKIQFFQAGSNTLPYMVQIQFLIQLLIQFYILFWKFIYDL